MKTCGIERHQRGVNSTPSRQIEHCCWRFLDVWAKIMKISKPKKSLNSHTTVNRLFLDISVKIGISFPSTQTLYLVSSLSYIRRQIFWMKSQDHTKTKYDRQSDRLNRSFTHTDLSFRDCASNQLFRVEIWSGVWTVYTNCFIREWNNTREIIKKLLWGHKDPKSTYRMNVKNVLPTKFTHLHAFKNWLPVFSFWQDMSWTTQTPRPGRILKEEKIWHFKPKFGSTLNFSRTCKPTNDVFFMSCQNFQTEQLWNTDDMAWGVLEQIILMSNIDCRHALWADFIWSPHMYWYKTIVKAICHKLMDIFFIIRMVNFCN